MSTRTYLFIGVVLGGMVYLVALLFGSDIAAWAVQRQFEAQSKDQVVLDALVFQPLEFLFAQDTRVVGAVGVAFFWPVLFILLFLLVVAVVILEFIDVNESITNPVSSLPIRLRMLFYL